MINPFPVAERGSFLCKGGNAIATKNFVMNFRQAIAPPFILDSSVGALA
ncbi:MAG: hypothetical protein V7K57_05505 [Nostoc sp.]